ncbi:DUF4365 domain-containing protein [Amycolatopsis sp. NPDC058278]|uniref:DUF4365 domain-containing protein n=1 Tax=Amycolatopsis sp. NPDC058278 TaxID=3346417 RepID=UPI0036DE7ED7
MRHLDTATTAQVGVDRVSLADREELGWLFRGQPIDDYGIDAQVEIVEAGEVVPRLLALQIKSGASFFSEPSPDGGWWFRPNAEHVRYWTNHVLPVVVLLVNPETKRCHWRVITPESLERSSRGGWKVRIPEDQVIDESARIPWRKLAEGDQSVARMRELRLAAPWMRLLESGCQLVVDDSTGTPVRTRS